jgi:hypothetical protein
LHIWGAQAASLQRSAACRTHSAAHSQQPDYRSTNKRDEIADLCFADSRIVGSKSEIQTVHNLVSSDKQLGLKFALTSER